MKNFLGILSLCIAAFGIVCMYIPFDRIQRKFEKKPENHLQAAIPANIGEMVSKDMPLGDTEEVIRATESILLVNEFLNREYKFPDGKTFSLYISYWEPNKEDLMKASEHTPDRCWVKNGWKNLDDKKRFDDILETDGKKLKPAYYRELTFKHVSGTFKRNVWFWFIADGERYTYFNSNDTYSVSPLAYIFNGFKDALKGSPEQYFVRIDSEYPLEDFYENKDFKKLLSHLGELILFEKSEENSVQNPSENAASAKESEK